MSIRRLLVPALCLAVIATSATTSAVAGNTVGQLAPAIAITDGFNGVTAKTKITDYKGSVTLFVLWLPICPHCKKFMPEVDRLQKKYEKKGLKVLTVTWGKKNYTMKYLADRKWTFGVGFDWTGVTSKRYGLKRTPGIYLLGKDNRLRSWKGTLEQAIIDELE